MVIKYGLLKYLCLWVLCLEGKFEGGGEWEVILLVNDICDLWLV